MHRACIGVCGVPVASYYEAMGTQRAAIWCLHIAPYCRDSLAIAKKPGLYVGEELCQTGMKHIMGKNLNMPSYDI